MYSYTVFTAARIPLLTMLCIAFLQLNAQIPSFPGAEGFGATTPGGRGGTVIKVTNLNADGPGSLRAALEATGPRIVVFETGGTIELNDIVWITDPYLTVAGQTAPGDGISIKNGTFIIQTHDVIIRNLRFRIGDLLPGPEPAKRYGICAWGENADNIIIDHCSASWAIAANFTAGQGSDNVTFSWCISAEALDFSLNPDGRHSMGMNHHSTAGLNLSTHHSIIAHNHQRNPQLKSFHNEAINNYVYNYGYRSMTIWLPEGRTANIVGNYFKPGVNTVGWPNNPLKGIYLQYLTNPRTGETGTGPNTMYLKGNVGPGREIIQTHTTAEEWLAVDDSEIPGSINAIAVDEPFFESGITTFHADTLGDLLFGEAGAGAIVPYRDPVDVRIIDSIKNNYGTLINSQDEVGGWPYMDPGVPPQDSDNDGMPDYWELAEGLNAYNGSDANGDLDGDGYTNIEEYVNGLMPTLSPDDPIGPSVPINLEVTGE